MKASSTLEFTDAAVEPDDSKSDVVTDDDVGTGSFQDYDSRDKEDVGTLQGEIEQLELQVRQLQDELAESKRTAEQSLFRLDNIKEKEDLVKFYTGFSDYVTLVTFMSKFWNQMLKL